MIFDASFPAPQGEPRMGTYLYQCYTPHLHAIEHDDTGIMHNHTSDEFEFVSWYTTLRHRLKTKLNFRLTKTKKAMKSTSMTKYLDLLAEVRSAGHASHAAVQRLADAVRTSGGNVQLSDADFSGIRASVCEGWQEKLDACFGVTKRFKFEAGSKIGTKPKYNELPFIVTTGWADKIGVRAGEALTVAPNRKASIKTATVEGKTRQFIVFE